MPTNRYTVIVRPQKTNDILSRAQFTAKERAEAYAKKKRAEGYKVDILTPR